MMQNQITKESVTVKPEGNITAGNCEAFRNELIGIIDDGAVNVVIDLNQVEIIDSRGLAVFLSCHKTLVEKNGGLTVVADNKNLFQLFRVMKLDECFTITTTSNE